MQNFLLSSILCHKNNFIKLTKREELSLRIVFALPNASMAGLASIIWSSKDPWIHTGTVVIDGTQMVDETLINEHSEACYNVDCTTANEVRLELLTPFFTFSPRAATIAKYWITLFVLTVFPAPDSPLTGWNNRQTDKDSHWGRVKRCTKTNT